MGQHQLTTHLKYYHMYPENTLVAILAFCPGRAGLQDCNSIQECLSGYKG